MTMYVLPESTKKKKNQVPGPPKIRPNTAGLNISILVLILSKLSILIGSKHLSLTQFMEKDL